MTRVVFGEHCVELQGRETLLDAFLRRGVVLPFSCRRGSCHTCLLRATRGSPPAAAQKGLRDDLRQRGYFLPCLCEPNEDLTVAAPAAEDMRLDALVVEKISVAPDVCVLRLEVGASFHARAGQHILIEHPSGALRAYSIAGLPDTDYFVEIHVQRVAHGLLSNWLHDEVAAGDALRIHLPRGDFGYGGMTTAQPLLLIGTGTGISPLIAIAREALRQGHRGAIQVFHGAREASGLYMDAAWQTLCAQHASLHYHGCLSREPARAPHHAGRAHEVALAALGDLREFAVFIAGHPRMVATASASCAAAGASDIRTDAFVAQDDRGAIATASAGAAHVDAPPGPDPELWQALREGELLHAVLVDFYAEIFADDRLGPYFIGVTQQRLVEKQYSFLRSLITGAREYFGQRPRNAHHWMVISNELFDYRLAIMDRWMRRHGLVEPWIGRWHAYENQFRSDIVKSQALPRQVGDQQVLQDGFLEDTMAVGTVCDACASEIEPGERVRYHTRLGTTYCAACANLHTRAAAG